ncbi:hypothetical protein N1851_018450 [Merluccius polli]|uniref:Uncharacterized protein n=1 Tax=Merluccius polli TaxID=89951 RepID=A0AA47MN24_MERPO|nr:hypothetical protein N1851_018450 [Merluccius polli]
MDLWPALWSEVYAEFQRVTNQNLPNTFYAEHDRHTPRLMTLFRQKASKTGKTADALADIFKVHDEQDDLDEPDLTDASVALLTTISDNAMSPVHYHPRLQDEILPQVEDFKCLGILFTSEGRMEQEIDRQIGAASAVMRARIVVKRELS